MSPRLRTELRYLGLGWSLLCITGAVLGGIVGWITYEADQ
jgi:hypothetical protein